MGSKMVAAESTGTSNAIKERYEKMKSLVGKVFFISFLQKRKTKVMKDKEAL